MNQKKNVNDYILLMTACIEPKNLNRPPSFRSDPSIRLADYKKALAFWLNYPDTRIIGVLFVENSGYPLDELTEIVKHTNTHNRQVEMLQFKESERAIGVHYGYSDMEIIDYAIDNSKIITPGSTLIKTTGRLYFPKLEKLLDIQDEKQYSFFSDARDYKLGKAEKHYVVTTLFIVKPEFYKASLYNVKQELLNSYSSHMETLYFKILKPLQSQNIRLSFPYGIQPVGVGAHSNTEYSSIRKKIQFSLAFFLRKALISLKFQN